MTPEEEVSEFNLRGFLTGEVTDPGRASLVLHEVQDVLYQADYPADLNYEGYYLEFLSPSRVRIGYNFDDERPVSMVSVERLVHELRHASTPSDHKGEDPQA